MKLTNNQIYTLGMEGFAKVNYAMLPTKDALEIYRLRKAIVKSCMELDTMFNEVKDDAWTDKELRARCAEYEQSKTGMTEEEYNAALGLVKKKYMELVNAIGEQSRDIDVHPISFASWCQLVQHNAFLSGFEEFFTDMIEE